MENCSENHLSSFLESKYHKWKPHATTIDKANGYGQSIYERPAPFGITVDHNKTILIAYWGIHCIVRWEWQTNKGTVIAGGNERGNRMDQLNGPTDVIVDKHNHSIVIADLGNRRVIRWFDQSQSNQQIIIDNIHCWGLAMDKEEFLYVSDNEKHEVRRWKEGEREGTLVAGGNGQGCQLNQLSGPTYLFVDDEQSVYVSDPWNHRVMKWRKGAKEGVIVAGGNGEGNSSNQLSCPKGVVVDRWRQIFVVDAINHRVMRWCEGEREGEIVVGGLGYGQRSDQLNNPFGLSFDGEGNLYVADCWNDRIQKFDLISS